MSMVKEDSRSNKNLLKAKDELRSIKNLAKVKFLIHRKGFAWFCAAAGFIFLASLAQTAYGIISREGVYSYSISDFSFTFFIGLVFAFIIIMIMYRQTNDRLSVFPQTNDARFITSQIINYAVTLSVGLVSLIIYLIYYAAMRLISAYHGNVYFAFDFDAGFVAAGFFIFAAYSFLILAVVELIGTMLRKWKYYAVAAFAALVSLAIINIASVVENAPVALAFLIREPSIGLFAIKAAAVWLAIFALSLLINHYTIYYNTRNTTKNNSTAIVCITISVAMLVVVPFVFLLNAGSGAGAGAGTGTGAGADSSSSSAVISAGAGAASITEFVDDFYDKVQETRIDISHIRRGGKINVASDGYENDGIIIYDGMEAITSPSADLREMAFLSGMEALDDIQGDTLVIMFRPPFYITNGVDSYKYANPRMNAYLEDDTLHIDYSIDEAHVLVLPIWGIARQFDAFAGKNLVAENLFGYSSGGNMNANIYISVE